MVQDKKIFNMESFSSIHSEGASFKFFPQKVAFILSLKEHDLPKLQYFSDFIPLFTSFSNFAGCLEFTGDKNQKKDVSPIKNILSIILLVKRVSSVSQKEQSRTF